MPFVGSLFSGVGGFDLGFEAAGFRVAWQCEIDRDAVSVLERHWPDVPRCGDIATVDPAALSPVDVVIFGSPCQDLSVAGNRAGLDGARSGLFGEAIRIIRGLRPAPAFCVWENVPGTLSSARGRDFGAVVDALAGAGALDIAWRILDARWFGVPQRRRRLFVVSDFGAERAASVLFEPQGGSRYPAARGAAGQGAARDAADGAGGAGEPVVGADENLIPVMAAGAHGAHGAGLGRAGDPMFTLDSTGAMAVAFDWQKGGGGNDHSWRGKSREWIERAGDYAGSLSATKHDAVAISENQRAATWDARNVTSRAIRTRVEYGAPANTLHAEGLSVITGPERSRGMAVRRLTPRECERLMGWDDDHTRSRADGSEIADGPRYRMIGNGVVAPVATWIARRMLAVLEGDS